MWFWPFTLQRMLWRSFDYMETRIQYPFQNSNGKCVPVMSSGLKSDFCWCVSLQKNIPKSQNDQQLPLSDRIFLNKAVTKIDWDSEATSEKNIKVTCDDGSLFPADFVLVTASLGFLKSNMHSIFIPALPPYKMRAIQVNSNSHKTGSIFTKIEGSLLQGLGFGTVDKIFIKFEKPWWTTEWGGISLLRRRSEEADSHWSDLLLGFYTVRLHPNILIAWITGKAAREVESLPENEILKVCSDLLRKYIGADFPFTEPVGLIISKWFSNPFTVGSYSYRSLESKEMNVWATDLAQPVYDSSGFPRLFFAGEATHDYFYSTVHGAVETGWREADRIVKYCVG